MIKARAKLRRPREDPTPPIFINEDLTKKRYTLLRDALKMKKTGKINDCWSFDGQILIKNKANKVIPVKNIWELTKNGS